MKRVIIVLGIISIIVSCGKKEEEARGQKRGQELGKIERKISEAEEKSPKLSKKESRLLGKYLGQKNGEQLSFEIKEDGTALFNVSGGVWRVEWEKYRKSPMSYEIPTLSLWLYRSNGDVCNMYYAGWRHEEDYREINGGIIREDVFVSFWRHGEDQLQAQQGSNQITLDKVYSSIEGTVYPGEVEIWERYEYISGPMVGEILLLERIPNYTPPGWKQIRGGHGKYFLVGISKWELLDGRVKFYVENKEAFELKIKGDTLVDEKENITFVKQSDDLSLYDLLFLTSPVNTERESIKTSKVPKIEKEVRPQKGLDSSELSLESIIKNSQTWGTVFQSWYGKPAPNFRAKNINGELYKLSDLRGKNVLCFFYSSWAPPCRIQLETLETLQKYIIEKDKVAILTISSEEAASSNLPKPFNEVKAVPTIFFIDSESRIRLAATGLLEVKDIMAILSCINKKP